MLSRRNAAAATVACGLSVFRKSRSVHERRRSSSSWSWSSSSTSSCSDRTAGLRPAATGERETASRIPMWPRDDLHVRDRDVQFVGCRRCLVGFWRPASSGAAFSVPDACIIPSLQSSRRRVFACLLALEVGLDRRRRSRAVLERDVSVSLLLFSITKKKKSRDRL